MMISVNKGQSLNFGGVGTPTKTKALAREIPPATQASVASVSVRLMERLKEGGGSGKERKETFPSLPSPTFLFFALAPFFARAKGRKLGFLPCSTETLATQAIATFDFVNIRSSRGPGKSPILNTPRP